MGSESEHDDEPYSTRSDKGAARRRVDAYHEALRERQALRDLEQPFVLEARAWAPR